MSKFHTLSNYSVSELERMMQHEYEATGDLDIITALVVELSSRPEWLQNMVVIDMTGDQPRQLS